MTQLLQFIFPVFRKLGLTLLLVGGGMSQLMAQAILTADAIKHTPALPPPPEAAALGKFGQTPVSLYTGVPQISIPIYTLKLQGLDVPVSLDYHAGGIRTSEMASNVGLGWVLQAGGTISSTAFGKPDFALNGYVAGATAANARLPPNRMLRPAVQYVPGGASIEGNADYKFLSRATACPIISKSSSGAPSTTLDTQPDVFQYSLPGRSGQFFHTQDGQAHPMPFEPLLITRLPGGLTGPWESSGGGYRLVDERGNTFLYDLLEVSTTYLTFINHAVGPMDDMTPHSLVYRLRHIQTVYGERVDFQYDTLTYRYHNVPSRTRFHKEGNSNTCNPRPDNRTESYSVVHSLQLTSITSSLGPIIQFEYATCPRLDVAGGRALSAIVVQEDNHTRRFQLAQGYFNGPDTVCPTSATASHYTAGPDQYRLKLLAVQEIGKPAYQFKYETALLPNRLSAGEDHWGFINGQQSQVDYPKDELNGFYDGYSREPDSTAMFSGMLREVHYPTGGFTHYVFEPNGFRVPTDSTTTYVQKQVSFYADTSTTAVSSAFPPQHGTFRLNTGQAIALVQYQGPPCGQSYPQFTVNITTQGTLVAQYCGTQPANASVSFQPNVTYDVSVQQYGSSPDSYFRLFWTEAVPTLVPSHWQCTGGLRIREAQDFDGLHATPARRQRYYYTQLDTTRTSGVTLAGNTPLYTTRIDEKQRQFSTSGAGTASQNPQTVTNTCHWLMQTANTQLPLSTIKGNNMAYTSVLVLTDEHGKQGLTQHKFSFAFDYAPYAGYPFTPVTSHDWERGLPIEQTDFRFDERRHSFHPVRRVTSHFTSRFTPPSTASEDSTNYVPAAQPNEAHALGLNMVVVDPEFRLDCTCGDGLTTGLCWVPATFYCQSYKLLSIWQYKDWERTTTFDPADSTKRTVVTSRYRYDNAQHAQVTASVVSTTATTRGTDSLLTRISYPLDFDTTLVSTPAARAIRYLIRTHQVGIPLETQHWRYTPTTGYSLTRGELLEYAGQWPRRSRSLLTDRPLSSATRAHIVQGALVADSHYQDALWLDSYDQQGHSLMVHRPGAPPTTFIWHPGSGELLAEATNAHFSQVASTSFEPRATGRWVYDTTGYHRQPGGRIGHYAYRLDASGAIRRAGLPAGDYTLVYWQQGDGSLQFGLRNGSTVGTGQVLATAPDNWHQYRQQLHFAATGAVQLDAPSGQVLLLDELRLTPAGAKLTSYTTDLLVGRTSVTGPDGRTTFYEYDALGRLVRTRDEQGRILSQQQYHYAGK
ncbi:RHS repeat domain-containing protein [Hymenobacter sp. CA2-7]|nr:RHS repeat domain-containing protein [Hymenobacter sp. CA2-7]